MINVKSLSKFELSDQLSEIDKTSSFKNKKAAGPDVKKIFEDHQATQIALLK